MCRSDEILLGNRCGGASDLKLAANLKRVRHGLLMWRKKAGRNEEKEICRLKELI